MIRLHVFPESLPGTPNPGPFALKLECALRLAGVPYEKIETGNPADGPKGKVPFVDIGGERIGDSTLVLGHLKETRGIDLDRPLCTLDAARSHAMQRMIEERLYWVLVYSRWCEPENFATIRELFFAAVPAPIRPLIVRKARREVRDNLYAHGIGRHTREEIHAFGAEDVGALSVMLGDQPFFFGEMPTLADAAAFGFLINVIGPDLDSPLKRATLARKNLVAYVERMGERFATGRPALTRAAA